MGSRRRAPDLEALVKNVKVAVLARQITLLKTFSILSALIMVLIGAVLVYRLQGMVEKIALDQEAALAGGQARALLHNGLLPQRGSQGLSARALRHLGAYTHQNMGYGLFVRVKVWSTNGTILYSDAPGLEGQRFPVDDGLGDVLSGRVTSFADISDLNQPENATERTQYHSLLEVYVPIYGGGAHRRIVGAYELYHDLTRLDAQEADLTRAIWFSVAAGFVILYGSLFFVVRGASRRLTRQSQEKAELLAQREAIYLTTLDAMARTIDARDAYTSGHSHRVAAYALAIGRALDLDEHMLRVLRRGAVLHDIGKIGVSDAVLNKPGRLTPEEMDEMQRHPVTGYELLRDMPFLGDELGLICHHHERWDGHGYPDGLAGEEIPLGARILAVCDAFDAMTSDRPYRRAMPIAAARAQLIAGAGTHFWPPAVAGMMAVLDAGDFVVPQVPELRMIPPLAG